MSSYKCLASRRFLPLLQLLRTQSTVPLQKHSLESSTESEVRPFKDIPGPKGLPYVGSIHRYMTGEGFKKMHKVVQKMFDEFGPIFKETMVGQTMVHVLDPVDIEKVFRSDGKYPVRPPMGPMEDYNKQKQQNCTKLVVTNGEEWRHVRQALAPKLMRPREVYDNIDNFNAVVDDALKSIRQARGEGNSEGEVPFLRDHLAKWATESIGTLVFDTRVGLYEDPPNEDAQKLIKAVNGFFVNCNELLFGLSAKLPQSLRFRTSFWKNFCSSVDELREIGQKFVDAKIKTLGEDLKDPSKVLSEKGVPLLTYLLAKQELSPADINASTVDIFAGGVDTTSLVLSIALNNLAKFPEVQERVHEEILSVIGRDGNLTARDMGKIPYTKAFLKESIRFDPPTHSNGRRINKDMVLAGYHVPAGTMVLASAFVGSKTHFNDPYEFKPERWLRESTADLPSAFSFLPFGFGPRMCIGKRVAELEIHLFISKALQQFRLECKDNKEPVESQMRLLLEPVKEMKISFIDRN